MAHAFQKLPANVAFGRIKESNYASDYTYNKKSQLAYCKENRNFNCKKSWSQGEYLLYNNAQNISLSLCSDLYNTSNLASNLYTKEDLKFVCSVVDTSGNCSPKIAPTSSSNPFYYRYVIDPCGTLFGVSPCGISNYANYMVPGLQVNESKI
jgi:hypothetical protein